MYLSTRLDAIKKTLNTLCKTATEEEKSFYESLYDLVSATAQQVDVIGSRLDELEEKDGKLRDIQRTSFSVPASAARLYRRRCDR